MVILLALVALKYTIVVRHFMDLILETAKEAGQKKDRSLMQGHR
jgi:hypothetical protein